MAKLKSIFFLLIILAFTGCDSRRVFEENKEIPDGMWASKNKVAFDFEIPDTTVVHNVFINIRNVSQYAYSNLYLFITTTYPDGKTSKDTVNCYLQDPSGKWLGEGLGDLWDNRLLFKPSVKFPNKGKYKIEFEQAMRIDPLPGIMDVGLRVEKVK